MPKFKKAKRIYHRLKKHHSRANHPSLLNIEGLILPRLLAHTGTAGVGYNDFTSGLSLSDRIKYVATNEVLLSTGYDAIGQSVNLKAPAVNYGMLLLPKVLRMIFGAKRVGKFTIW